MLGYLSADFICSNRRAVFDWQTIIIYRQATSAHSTQTEVVSKRRDRLYQNHRNNNSTGKCYSMDLTSLYTNLPREEGIETVWKTYDSFYKDISPIPTQYLKRALKKIVQENSFGFNGQYYLQIHGTAMGTTMAVAFANILMAVVETEILNRSILKPLVWKRYIDDIF